VPTGGRAIPVTNIGGTLVLSGAITRTYSAGGNYQQSVSSPISIPVTFPAG
jgi:hypothetical protein